MTLDRLDKRLLNLVQSHFPVVCQPYQELAKILGTSEEEVLARLQKLMEKGIIRRLGPIFDSSKLGYSGTLCAVRVPSEKVREVAEVINSFPGVTHNYLRNHSYNMWFTLLAESPEKLQAVLEEIKERTGITDILNLPAQKVFKIRVNFPLEDDRSVGRFR